MLLSVLFSVLLSQSHLKREQLLRGEGRERRRTENYDDDGNGMGMNVTGKKKDEGKIWVHLGTALEIGLSIDILSNAQTLKIQKTMETILL